MGKPKFPMVVKRGHTTVKIYKTPSNKSDQFTVVHYLGTERQRKTFSDLGLAITEAETTASKLSQGELNVLELRNEDRLSYVRAIEALRPLGVPLEMAVMQFVEAVKALDGASLIEAAHCYAKHRPHKVPKKKVAEVIDELIAANQADRLSDVYLRDLKGHKGVEVDYLVEPDKFFRMTYSEKRPIVDLNRLNKPDMPA